MSRATVTSIDIDRLRAIVDIANDVSAISAMDVTYAVLDQVREMIGADWASFHDMKSSARRIRHLQDTDGTVHVTAGEADLGNDAEDPFWKHYHSCSCSFPDRADKPMVVSVREVYSEREWAGHPMHLEALPDVFDEILGAWPCGPGVNLRLLVGRTGGQPFSDLDRFMMRLLQPHLQPLLKRTLRAVVPPSQPPLTDRQRQILQLVGKGMTNQQVAHQLAISPATVRKHLENSYGRLHVQSRVAAVGVAFKDNEDDFQQGVDNTDDVDSEARVSSYPEHC